MAWLIIHACGDLSIYVHVPAERASRTNFRRCGCYFLVGFVVFTLGRGIAHRVVEVRVTDFIGGVAVLQSDFRTFKLDPTTGCIYSFSDASPDSEPMIRKLGPMVTMLGTRNVAPKLEAPKSSMSPVWKETLPKASNFRAAVTLPSVRNQALDSSKLLRLPSVP